MSERIRLVVYSANSKLIERDLSPDLQRRLGEAFETTWMFARALPPGFDRPALRLPAPARSRFRVWLYTYELAKYAFLRPVFGPGQPKPHLGLSRGSRRLLAAVLRTGLGPVARLAGAAYLRRTAPPLPRDVGTYDICVTFSSPNDPVYDDVVRDFRRRDPRMPIVVVPLNWDNASSKPYLEAPDVVLTWGRQTAALSRDLHGIHSEALGSPRFDPTLVPPPPSREDAQRRLGLDPSLEYILFAGSSFPFDETAAVNAVAGCIARIPDAPYRILYRPHPVPWPRSHVTALSDESRQFVLPDPTSGLFETKDLKAYQYLFQAVRGLITPYSTMVVEAARYGVPSLALGYNSPHHPEFDWEANSSKQPHLRFAKASSWVIECRDEGAVAGAFGELLGRMSDPAIAGEAKAGFAEIVRVTNRGYADELIDALRAVAAAGRRAKEGTHAGRD